MALRLSEYETNQQRAKELGFDSQKQREFYSEKLAKNIEPVKLYMRTRFNRLIKNIFSPFS